MELEQILKQIYPEQKQMDCLSGIVSSLGNMLTNSSNILKIKKVTPAGSLYKKTILKNHLEVDCVYILEHNGYSFYTNFNEIIRVLEASLPQNTPFDTSDHSISFNLDKPIGSVFVDLLAAYELNNPLQMREVNNKDAYYGSTSLFQREYHKNLIEIFPRFCDMVRLLKLWRNTRDIPLSSYMLELIASNAISDTKEGEEFDFFLEVGFRTIQSFTDGRPILPVYWEHYFKNSEIQRPYSHNELWIIDPSDPSENIAADISDEEKRYIQSEATDGVNCMRNKNYSFLYE